MATPWRTLAASQKASVDLPMTLCGGQCFRWHLTQSNTYVGVIGRRAYELRYKGPAPSTSGPVQRTLPQASPAAIEYRRLGCGTTTTTSSPSRVGKTDDVADEELLASYLSLDVPLPALWNDWTLANPMKHHPLVAYLTEGLSTANKSTEPFASIRHLRQDIHETLFCFLCSQNNHVKRITAMVDSLCATYGDYICSVEGIGGGKGPTTRTAASGRKRSRGGEAVHELFTFPTISQLLKVNEESLRKQGFGYRSKFVVGCVQSIAQYESPRSSTKQTISPARGARHHHSSSLQLPFYLDLVSTGSLEAQRAMLMTLPGVGRKVADCVLLFSLGHADLVPVDTHMARVAADYLSPTAVKRPSRPRRRSSAVATSASSRSLPCGDASDWQSVVMEWKRKGQAKTRAARGPSVARDLATRGKNSSKVEVLPVLTERHHDAIQQGFRELFGPHAGWAHSILFYKRMR